MLRCLVASRSHLIKYRNGLSICRWQHVQYPVLSRAFSNDGAVPGPSNQNRKKKGRAKAVHQLAFLVSEQNALSSSPQFQTPRDIKGFYTALKAKGHLQELSSYEFSNLIRLFGSLSVLADKSDQTWKIEDDNSGPFALHPLALLLQKRQSNGRRIHWDFVLSVAKDKAQKGFPWGQSDNFWLMRSTLEDAKRITSEDTKSNDIKLCLQRAKEYYLRIRSRKGGFLGHQLYLTGLYDYGGTEYFDEIIYHLANLLEWAGGLPPKLRVIVWRILAGNESNISPATRSRFLQVLRKKLAKARDFQPAHSRISSEASPEVQGDIDLSRIYDALAVRDYFSDLIFSFDIRQSLQYLSEIYPWALFECRAALCAFNDGTFATTEQQDRAAWNNLALLSLSFAPAPNTSDAASIKNVAPEQGLDGGLYSSSQVLGWTVICSLAALSSELRVRLHTRNALDSSSALGVQEIARTLWFLWRKEEAWRAGAVARSISLNCCVSTSFMALASISGDPRLAVSLIRHISDTVIYPARLGTETLDQNMLHDCAVHFAVLSATWGVSTPPQQSWHGIVGVLRYTQLIPDDESSSTTKRIKSIAISTLMHLAHIDPMLSHKLYHLAGEYGIVTDTEVIFSVGKALASDGHINLAFNYLKDTRISPSTASQLLDALLSSALHYHRDRPRYGLVQLFVEVFAGTSIRPTNNNALEAFISTCVHAGYPEEAMKIVQSVCESTSTLLRPAFLAQMVTVLASHRRYKLLGKVLKETWHKIPERRMSLFRGSRLQYTKQLLSKFPKASVREIARSLPFSIHVWPVLRNHIPFHPRLARLNRKIISLKISSQLQKAGEVDEKTLEHAVHLLVIAGRISAAIKLVRKYSPTISTKAGNIILNASLQPRASRRGRRQVRHAASRLTQLFQERQFMPDRITINLLMKALLRWKSITPSLMLRALFDRLTLNGYPLPDDFFNKSSRSIPPTHGQQTRSSTVLTSRTVFGTDLHSIKSPLPVNLKAFSKHISFTRHTRPLYKMFLKAFEARGDHEGAQRVARVLREVDEKMSRERAVRDEVRRLGRIRAGQRLRSAKRNAISDK